MKTAFTKIATLLLCIVCIHTAHAQCTTIPIALNDRISKATYIVIGEVTARHCYADKDGNIFTLNKLMIKAWAKNNQPESSVYVITNGGILKNKAQVTTPSLQLMLNNQYLLMLERDNTILDDKNTRSAEPGVKQAFAYADAQGAMLYQDKEYYDAPSAKRMNEATALQNIYTITNEKARTPDGAAYSGEINDGGSVNRFVTTISGFSPNPTNAGTVDPNDFLTITGSGFGSKKGKVEFKNADDGGVTYITVEDTTTDIVTWSDVSIKVKVPSNAGTGLIRVNGKASSQVMTINYAHESIISDFDGFTHQTRQRYYLRNIVDTAGYLFKYNTSSGFSTNGAAIAAFERSLNTWKCKTGINWLSKGSTQKGYADDGENVVQFDNTLPAGTLGVTTYRLSGGSFGNCTKEKTVWFLAEVDMRFAEVPLSGYTWQFGPQLPATKQYDFESVTLHELGHAHGLGHRIAAGQTMNYSISNGISIRTPSAIEINGASNKMSYSTVPSCFNPDGSGKPMTIATCVLPVSIISFKVALQNESVLASWQTATEINAAYFTVERSVNGTDFITVGKVAAAGNSSTINSYHYSDNVSGLAAGMVYYRLRETDVNGQLAVTGINTVNIPGKLYRVYPNPATNFIKVEGQHIAVVQVFDVTGKPVIRKSANAGNMNTINTSALSKGVYTLVITNSKGDADTRKLVIE